MNHKTFNEESEKPPATKDPSCDIDAQFKLEQSWNSNVVRSSWATDKRNNKQNMNGIRIKILPIVCIDKRVEAYWWQGHTT